MSDLDAAWKCVIEDLFPDFMKFFFPDLYPGINFRKKWEFKEKELQDIFPQKDPRKKYVDKLAKVYLKDDSEKWILIHVEIQGYGDRNFSQRMFTYYYRILDKYHKDITAIAIFTDSNKNYNPGRYEANFYQTKITYEYRTYKVLAQKEEELLKLKNPFGLVILSARKMLLLGKDLDEQFTFRYDIMKRLLLSGYSREKIIRMLEFIERTIQLPEEMEQEIENKIRNDEEIKEMAEELVMGSFSKRYYNKGLLEGELKGEIKGKTESTREIAAGMLRENLPVEMISKITGLSVREITKIKKKLTEN
jgi:hypothetical protein